MLTHCDSSDADAVPTIAGFTDKYGPPNPGSVALVMEVTIKKVKKATAEANEVTFCASGGCGERTYTSDTDGTAEHGNYFPVMTFPMIGDDTDVKTVKITA